MEQKKKKQTVELDKNPAKNAELSNQERLNALIEEGKKKGMLSAKELLDVLEEMNLDQEQIDKFYDTLENLGIDATEDDSMVVMPDDDVAPELEELENIEEISKEELADTDALIDSFSIDDPVRMYLKEIGKVSLLTPEERCV